MDEIVCKQCGEKFLNYLSNDRKYCSMACRNIAYKKNPLKYWSGKKRSKETIDKIIKSKKGKSVKHSSQFKKGQIAWNKGKKFPEMSGEKHPNWNGGGSREYKTGYYSSEYKNWRLQVFMRDNFTCQCCKLVGGYLTAHHIKSFAHYPELRFDSSNGITLCEECHKLTDNYKGKGLKK